MRSNTRDEPALGEEGAAQWKKGQRVVGAQRRRLVTYVVRRYREGATIRVIAAATGRSYGYVHKILGDSGVPLRPRGGQQRRCDPTTPACQTMDIDAVPPAVDNTTR